jgi:hypothetical protein
VRDDQSIISLARARSVAGPHETEPLNDLERLGGLEIDNPFKLRARRNRQLAWLLLLRFDLWPTVSGLTRWSNPAAVGMPQKCQWATSQVWSDMKEGQLRWPHSAMAKRTKLPTIVMGRSMGGGASAEKDPKVTFELDAETGEIFEVSFSLVES